jgi:hypothetical protein
MNKKVITPIVIIVVLALITAVVIYAPSIWDAVLRMHGMR